MEITRTVKLIRIEIVPNIAIKWDLILENRIESWAEFYLVMFLNKNLIQPFDS